VMDPLLDAGKVNKSTECNTTTMRVTDSTLGGLKIKNMLLSGSWLSNKCRYQWRAL